MKYHQTSYSYLQITSARAHDFCRTFNSVEAVLKAKGIRFDKIFQKINRPKQSHLTKKERLADENPFVFDTELDLNGKEILLVDDIYTTGLTIGDGCKSIFYAKNIRKFGNLLRFVKR